MELLEGGELLDLVVREGAVAEARAVGYMVQILRGVAHMHSRGVVHRDLKLDNFVLTAARHAHLTRRRPRQRPSPVPEPGCCASWPGVGDFREVY